MPVSTTVCVCCVFVCICIVCVHVCVCTCVISDTEKAKGSDTHVRAQDSQVFPVELPVLPAGHI